MAGTSQFRFEVFKQSDMTMSTGFGDFRREQPPRTGDHVSGDCRTRRPFFVVAVVLMASAPWVLLEPDRQTHTELNR